MRDAQQKLEEAKRKESIEDQRKAEDELAKAKKELEEILKQLREEEVERMLAMLEGRFRSMLERELKVYEATRLMATVQAGLKEGETNSELEINTAKQALEQRLIAREADNAYNMLLDEGSSIAFPETVLQMSEDMKQVSERLNQTKVGRLTQELEEDIIDTLGYIH